MQIACPACRKTFSLDDAKVPAKAFAVKCPSCSGKITVTPPSAEENGIETAGSPPPPPVRPSAPSAPEDRDTGGDPGVPAGALGQREMEKIKREVMAEILKGLGIKTLADSEEGEEQDIPQALVCEDEALFQEAIKDALSGHGYKVEVASTAGAAISMVQKFTYDLITVDNRFPDDPEGGYKVLQAINSVSPDRRRKMFVAFVSADLATMDTNSAFILGANVTVSKKDIKRLNKVLSQARMDHDRLYRTFYQVEEEVHRAEV